MFTVGDQQFECVLVFAYVRLYADVNVSVCVCVWGGQAGVCVCVRVFSCVCVRGGVCVLNLLSLTNTPLPHRLSHVLRRSFLFLHAAE